MTILARTRLIIQQLYRSSRHVSVSEIADRLEQTERTIYREMPEVTEVLNSCGVWLESAVGKGLKLSGNSANLKQLEELIGHLPNKNVSPADRAAVIEFRLLEIKDFTKISTLAMDCKTSVQTVRNELKVIEKRLAANDLKLEIKKGEGVRVIGTELSKRHYLADALANAIDVDVFVNWMVDGKLRGRPVLELLRDHGYHGPAAKIFEFVMHAAREYRMTVSDRSLRDIVFLIAMLVARRDRRVNYAGRAMHADASDGERAFAARLVAACEATFQLDLSPAEREYMGWLGAVILGKPRSHTIGSNGVDVALRTARLISEIQVRLGLRLDSDHQLLKGLNEHLSRTMTRVRSGIIIRNPINKSVQQNYLSLFETVKASAQTVFADIDLPDEEIGYLVLHVANAIDQLAAESFRVLVVCSSGMGSSKLLTARLEREIAELKVVKQIALVDLYSDDLGEYDLVISTVPIYQTGENVIMVSPLLTEEEAAVIRHRVKSHRLKHLSRMSTIRERKSHRPQSDVTKFLREIEAVSRWGTKILDGLRVSANIGSQTDLAKALGSLMYRLQLIEDADLIVRYVSNENGCFVIPGSRVAFAECCVKELSHPSLLVLQLDGSRHYQFGCSHISNVDAIAVLVFPLSTEACYIDLIQDVSLLLIDNAECITALRTGQTDAIEALMGERIANHLASKF